MPSSTTNVAIKMIRKGILKRAEFDINECSPVKHVGSAFIPALFVHGEQDDFIKPHHSERLYEAYAGDKNRIIVAGGHNSSRPQFMRDSVSIFFAQALQLQLIGW